ncbi:MAG: integrase core domain-containing protein [Gaiellaceae bacterium]
MRGSGRDFCCLLASDNVSASTPQRRPHWLDHYNTTRPHSSIGDRPPISRVHDVRGRTARHAGRPRPSLASGRARRRGPPTRRSA